MVGIAVFAVAIIVSFTFNLDENFSEPNNFQRFEIIEPEYENSENLKILHQKNLNKITTQKQFFGFTIDSSNSIIEATNSEQKFSIRFTSKFSSDVSSILFPMTINKEDKIKVDLQEDAYGFPSGLSLASAIHHPTASFNGLESWIEWYDADAAFKFINSN